MKKYRYGAALISLVLCGALVWVNSINTFALGGVTLPTEREEEIMEVSLPTIAENEDSPFDFVIDPQALIFETDAALYGGWKVEEGAYLLFRRHDGGEYLFAGRSDMLTASNRGSAPMMVTITASVDDLGDIRLSETDDLSERDDCSMYLALVDDEGNEWAIPESGELSVSVELAGAREGAGFYRIDEENGSYEFEEEIIDEEEFPSYSFGLRGAINPNGEWEKIDIHPSVRVTWKLESEASAEEQENRELLTEEALSEEIPDEIFDDTEEVEEMSGFEDIFEEEASEFDEGSGEEGFTDEDTVSEEEEGMNASEETPTSKKDRKKDKAPEGDLLEEISG